MKEIIAQRYPDYFNYNNEGNKLDSRSDDNGVEPEGAIVGEVGGRVLGFISVERIGGIFMYDITEDTAVDE